MTWYFDLPNLLVCILAIIIACRMKIIPNWIGLIFTIYSFIPFLLNDFLFPSRFMKDQFYYFDTMKEVRSFNFLPHNDPNILITTWVLSFLPLPFVETIKSIGFYNRFMFFVLFCWLYNKKFLKGGVLLFLIFYPSLVLYTSLSLRDPLILCIMLVSVIFLIDKKYFRFFLLILPLYFLKWQNFYFMIVLFLVLIVFKRKSSYNLYRVNKFKIFIALICLLIFMFLFTNDILHILNLLRKAMYIENSGNLADYLPIHGLGDLLFYSITAFPYFLLKPLPWQSENLFQLIQSFENIFLLIFLFFFTKKAFKQGKLITYKWLLYSVFVMTIYGLVVFNFGTSVRYKFIIVAVYVIGLSYELYRETIFRSYTKS
tara:strand:+ start:2290 stop:3402 length:1113 start_codon:yes stop_codon:yes gene_type:complete